MHNKFSYLILVSVAVLAVNPAVAELVAYYPLNEGTGTTVADTSGKGHNGTITGNNVQWVDSLQGYGRALDFPGTWGQYCDTGTWNPSAATGKISVAFWMKWDGDNGGYQGVVSKRDTWSDTATMWCIEIDMNSLMMNWHRFGSWVDVGISPAVGKWQHVVITYDGSTARSYIDGNLHKQASGFTFGPATNAHVVFGAVEQNGNPFNGTLDEVRIYDHALSTAEIKALAAKYGASNPTPADGDKVGQTALALTWAAAAFADSHHVYFSDNYDAVYNGAAQADKGVQTWALYWAADLQIGKTYYWRVDEISATHPDSPWRGTVWSFTIPPKAAWQPKPADGAKYVDTSPTLTWSAGLGAFLHHVYLGTNLDAVKNADPSDKTGIYRGPVGTTPPSYTPPVLAFETDYYWRVDEFEATGNTNKGPVWSFTTTPPGLGTILREVWEDIGGDAVADLTGDPKYPDNPSRSDKLTVFDFWDLGLDNYGSRLRGWLHVPVTGNYTFWIASDNGSELWLSSDDDPANVGTAPIAQVPGTNWTGHYEWEKFPEQKSAPITLASGRYYIEALMKEGGGGDGVAVAWQGPAVPNREVIKDIYLKPFEALWALGPKPPNRATDVGHTPTLSWKPGEKAAKHDVYFGTNEQTVAGATTSTAGIYRGRQNLDATSYAPPEAPLEWAKTYYWRIDEVNGVDMWKGSVWSFTTANFLAVDDFEDYTGDVGSRIFQTWKDGLGYNEPPPGYGGNGTGSAVGNSDAPWVEQTMVHSGGQSMPLNYNNSGLTGKARYSETFREWAAPQDWTAKGVKALILWFHGDPNNAAETLYVAVKDSPGTTKVVTHPNPDAAISNSWQEWNIDLKEFSSAGVNLAGVKTMYIGLGNRVSPKAGGTGRIYIDDIRLYLPRCVPSLLKPAADVSGNCIVDYLDLQIVTNNWLATGTPPNDAKLVAHYALEGNFNDSSSYAGLQNGDPRNGASIISDPARGQVAHFDGINDFVDCGTFNPSAATGRLTVALWAKWNGLSGLYQGLIAKRDTWAAADMMWQIEANIDNGTLGFFREGSSPPDGDPVLPVGQWAHVAATFDGTIATFYLNGKATGSGNFSFGSDTQATVVFGACEQNGGNPFNGDLDEIRIYDYALSAAEVFHLAEPAADLNNDNKVNFADFAILADAWLDELLWPQP